MSIEFDRFIEELKEKSDLVEVIETTSEYRFDTRRVGRYIKCKHPDSLMVDADWGVYTWFAKGGANGHTFETGDVFHWLERYGALDFWAAALWLAQRYSVKIPESVKRVNPAAEKRAKSRHETLELCCKWFEDQLWADQGVVDYCLRRGWTEDTIRTARLGFSPGYKSLKGLVDVLRMNEVNLDDPITVSVIGKRGGVATWIEKYGIKDVNPDWVGKDQIHGLGAMPRLIYPHVWRGRVTYFSARNLTKDGESWVGGDKPKSFNLHRSLTGERPYYFNSAFTRGTEICLVVEGQADAISAAQLGFGAVALAGVNATEKLVELFAAHKIRRVFVGLDSDKAGKDNALKTADLFGPLTRLIQWSDIWTEESDSGPSEKDHVAQSKMDDLQAPRHEGETSEEGVATTGPVGFWEPVGEEL